MTKMEANGVLRNGEIKKAATPHVVIDKDTLSLSSSSSEDGRHTPLPGSTWHLEMNDQEPSGESEYQVRVTVIPSIPDDVRKKSSYSRYQQHPPRLIPRPDNHLCMGIVGMFCCIFPLGIVGLVCALKVDATYDDGDREGAVWRSSHAKYWSLTAIVCGMLGVLGGGFYVIFFHLVPVVS